MATYKPNSANPTQRVPITDDTDIARSLADKSVLILGEYGSLNGGEHSLLAAIPALTRSGVRLTAAVPPETDFAKALSAAGVTIESLSLFDEQGVRQTQQEIRGSIATIVGRVKPGLVHANSLSMSRLLGPVIQNEQTKTLGHFRDILKLSKKAIFDLNLLDRIIAVSQATADFHINQGIAAAKIEVVHNGVDLARFCPNTLDSEREPSFVPTQPTLRSELGISDDAEVCLFVGQIGMRKGVDSLLDLLSPLCVQRENLHLVIVGSRHSSKDEAIEYEQNLHQRSQKDFPSGRVHWLGRRIDIARIMRESNVLIHPAKQEPLGRVLLEAAASGLPIVTTDVGGSREILSELEDCLFPPDDFCAACELVSQMLDDTMFRQNISKKLREVAVSRFSAQIAGENYLRVYQFLLNQREGSAELPADGA